MVDILDYKTIPEIETNMELLGAIPFAPHWVSNKLLRKSLGYTFSQMNYQIGKLEEKKLITHVKYGRIHYYQRIQMSAHA